MDLIIQICPIGLELQRILAGLQFHPCNRIYLLTSRIEAKDYKNVKDRELDDKLVELSEVFTQKIKQEIPLYKVDVKYCSFIINEKIVKDLCEIIKNIYKEESNGDEVKDIWINIGTATKLFVAAGMYIASFNPDIIHLFYVNAKNYTINLLFDDAKTKEDIRKVYEEQGITFSTNGREGYELVDIPIIPSEQISDQARDILIILNEHTDDDFNPDWVTLESILTKLGVPLDSIEKKDIPKIKMKYHHHIAKLIERKLIEEEKHGKRKRYILTDSGIILAIILDCFKSIRNNDKKKYKS